MHDNFLSHHGKFHLLFVKFVCCNKIVVLWDCHWLLHADVGNQRISPRGPGKFFHLTKLSHRVKRKGSVPAPQTISLQVYINAYTRTQTHTQGKAVCHMNDHSYRETNVCYSIMVVYLSSWAPAVSPCLAALNSSLLLLHPYILPHFSAIHQGTLGIHLLATKMTMK